MWNKIKQWFCKEDQSINIYHPKERVIYKYWDGKKLIEYDPMVLYKKMMDKGPELQADIRLSMSSFEIPAKAKAREDILTRLRTIFSVQKFEEGGLTESETMDLFDHFLEFCDSVKKNVRTSLPVSTPSQSLKPSLVENPTTTNSLDSGSTNKESSTDKPTSSVLG